MPEKRIEHQSLGSVVVRKHKGAKNVRISIRDDGVVQVSIPKWAPYNLGLKHAVHKIDWIREHRPPLVSPMDRDKIYEGLIVEGRQMLEERLDELSRETGLIYNQVRVKKLRSRWGSCTSKGYISLNGFLAGLPHYLIDYVLIHELSHTKHQNHSHSFWLEVEKHMPEYKKNRKELKGYNHMAMRLRA